VRVAFVAPRYGDQIVGGAEAAMRMIAERLASMLGWQVEALTSCSSDYMSWENDLPEGESRLNGVRVRRFPSLQRRTVEFDLLSDRLLREPARAGLEESDRWIDLQGPRCPELVEALVASDAQVVAFSPYLYYPAVRGVQAVARRSLLHPAAHDEPQVYLPAFRDVFTAAASFVFNAGWERQFVQQLFGVASTPSLTLGLGVDDPGDDVVPMGAGVDDPFGIRGRPYVCCLGRVDAGKGTPELVELFARYKQRNAGPLALVLVGPVVMRPQPHADVVVAGQVDEATKWSLLDGSIGLVSPSPFESFAIVLLEAWSRRRPAIVNGRCAATSEQCRLSGAGRPYGSFEQLEALLNRLVADCGWRAELGERGRAYVDRHFRWPGLIERWGRFAEGVAERAGGQ
jgi:glycosyltransferase involved in cell wall biosynthesis